MLKPRQVIQQAGRWVALLILLGSLLASLSTHAQETQPLINATFEGVIQDAATQEPLAGATL